MSANKILFYGLLLVCSTFRPLTLAVKPDDGCGPSDLGQESGHLSSKNYPGLYPNNSYCELTIRVPSTRSIVLQFKDLSIEERDCETDYLKVLKESHGAKNVYWQYCGDIKSLPELSQEGSRSLYTDSSELFVSFRTSHHTSGQGFLLSYTTVEHKDVLKCSDKGSHFSISIFRKYCPVGCGTAAGDVAGDVSQGYRHTSVLCKAAVHAGVIMDQFGGPITVEEHRGLRHYEAIQANGILSAHGSLSDSLFTFVTNDCKRQTILQPVSVTSSWEKAGLEGTNITQLGPNSGSVPPDPSSKSWLQLDLGEKRRITSILTKGMTTGYFVKSYKIEYKEKSRWRTYSRYNSSEDMTFKGNVDSAYQTRNNFHPAIVARSIRVVPLKWHQGIGLMVELVGCPYVRTLSVLNASSQVTQEVLPTEPKLSKERDLTEPVPSQADFVRLAIIVGPIVLTVALLLVGICLFFYKKKTKESTYDSADPPQTGCWKQVKHPAERHQSTEFTFSYSSEKDPIPKMDLVTSNMADYQQPLMLGVGTVTRKGSTFRPMDMDKKAEPGDAASHYDHLHTANQYALPLTNQEPEYATPIIERHAFRKDVFLPDPSYSVPGTVPSKRPSFKTVDGSNYRKVVGAPAGGGYQTPQVKVDRANHSDGVYDSPKIRRAPVVQNGGVSDYKRPQTKTPTQDGYCSPRDCVRLDSAATCRPDPEGCSLSGS